MKFKYNGQDDSFCLELMAYGIMKKGEYLKKGMIIDVPDKDKRVISALQALGTFEEIKQNNKPINIKNKNKEK